MHENYSVNLIIGLILLIFTLATATVSKPISVIPPPSVEVVKSPAPESLSPHQDCKSHKPALESSSSKVEAPTAYISPYTPPPEVRDLTSTKSSTAGR